MFNRFKWSAPSRGRNRMTATYEPIQPFLFCAFAAALEINYVFDIGANIGQYSLFATQVRSADKIYAYEAEEAAFSELALNIHLNEMQHRIVAYSQAASSQGGEVIFAVAKPMAGNNAIASTSIHRPSVYSETRKVGCVALDEAHAISGRSLCFKIDVEGHEAEVLRGAEQLLNSNECVLQVEIYRDNGKIKELLNCYGYKQIFAAGADCYFTNSDKLADPAQVIRVIEKALSDMINYNLRG